MIKLLKKQPTVEQIHAEFDSAEERILNECDAILAQLQIPTESKIERKANMLVDLGFVNSEVVKQANSIKENQKEIKNKIDITSLQASYIRELKVKYPKEKFITVDELERICEKYNLIHAPVSNYIKDIPEKNVLEMTNCKKLQESDKVEGFCVLYVDRFWNEVPKDLREVFKNGLQVPKLHIYKSETNFMDAARVYGNYKGSYTSYIFFDARVEEINKSGLFIAAPKSHFNLKGLNKKSKFGFFTVTVKEVKDPVVFEYCKNNICRIITKWGTEDDQSYLDPDLFDEKLN